MLALLTVLHGPQRPQLVLLDDFDHALHPRAQIELVQMIKGLLEEFDDLQIVATTHSPYILDEIDPSDVHAFALRDEGTVASKRLSEHPEAKRRREPDGGAAVESRSRARLGPRVRRRGEARRVL